MTPDTTTSTPDAAGRHARAGAGDHRPTRVELLKEAVDPQANPAGELTHHHRPDVACLACALQASLERLNGTCERCCVVLDGETDCPHGMGLCGHCKPFCDECVDDASYDETESRRSEW